MNSSFDHLAVDIKGQQRRSDFFDLRTSCDNACSIPVWPFSPSDQTDSSAPGSLRLAGHVLQDPCSGVPKIQL